MPKNKGGKNYSKGKKSSFTHVEPYCTRKHYPGTEYMFVDKALGNLRFDGTLIVNDLTSPNIKMNGMKVLARVGGKLRKRRDRVDINDIVLVGIRDWATSKKKVDIVWTYKDKGNIKKLIRHNELSESQALMGRNIDIEESMVSFEEPSAEDLERMKKLEEAQPKESGCKVVESDVYTGLFNDEIDDNLKKETKSQEESTTKKKHTTKKTYVQQHKTNDDFNFDDFNFDDI